MAGNFQLEYQHGVPSFNHWPEILEKNSWKSNRHYIGCPSCHNLNWSNWRFNCALRLHREHKPDCPAGKRTGREEGLLQSAGNGQHDRNVQATNKNNLKQGRALGDVPPIHESDLSRKKPRLTEQEWCDDPMKTKFFCGLRDAHAVDLSIERLVFLQFGGSAQQRNNISRPLDHELSGTKTNQKTCCWYGERQNPTDFWCWEAFGRSSRIRISADEKTGAPRIYIYSY